MRNVLIWSVAMAAALLLLVLNRATRSSGPAGNALRRITRLDARAMPGLRQAGEAAETYLRRVASREGRRIGPLEGHAVAEALREYFAATDSARPGNSSSRQSA